MYWCRTNLGCFYFLYLFFVIFFYLFFRLNSLFHFSFDGINTHIKHFFVRFGWIEKHTTHEAIFFSFCFLFFLSTANLNSKQKSQPFKKHRQQWRIKKYIEREDFSSLFFCFTWKNHWRMNKPDDDGTFRARWSSSYSCSDRKWNQTPRIIIITLTFNYRILSFHFFLLLQFTIFLFNRNEYGNFSFFFYSSCIHLEKSNNFC